MRRNKMLFGGLVVAVLCSGCAVKWQVNPVTWTDDKDGYDLRDVRQAVRGSQPRPFPFLSLFPFPYFPPI